MFASEACSAKTVVTQSNQESNLSKESRKVNENSSKTNNPEELQIEQTGENSIKNAKGLIVLSKYYRKNDFISFYNEDGSLWYKFTYYYDDSDGKFEYSNVNFDPFAFHPDNFVLVLKCVGKDREQYEAIVKEKAGLKKFVRKDDAALEFETWEKHILKAFAIDFNRKENRLREALKGKIVNIDLSKKVTLHPVEIKGEWLKIS